ncbi:MAG TPA: glycoside hydrolase family 15 protein, partial [Solirubrobacteraceae bacterium]|nr:glycoside hydrolase family 15 protein [Solirubrobacteraceae bacterium]
GEDAGHWSIRPRGSFDVERRYVDETMVLETTFRTGDGCVRVTDALALGAGERGHGLGAASPHRLLRLVEGLEGEVRLEVEYVPRPEYGLVVPDLLRVAAGVQTVGGPDALLLATDVPLDLVDGRARGNLVVSSGERRGFALHHHGSLRPADAEALDVADAVEDTLAGWRSWSELHRGYDGPYRDEVFRSALVLQALTYQPTGAIVAAPTTSLPELPGGEFNWDYRFAWLRDASLTLEALWVGACPDEAERFFDWMALAASSRRPGEPVQIMFGVGGERDLTEHALDHLDGFGGSRPVRVGNDAWRQQQLDVMGEVLEAAWILRDQIGTPHPHTAAFLTSLVDEAAARWREQDSGIWEGREGTRDYTTSKLMCWVALDRGVKLAGWLGAEDRVDRWGDERDAVHAALLEEGWSDAAGAYSGAFGSDHLDAGVLLMPILGFLPADAERMRATIDAIERDLAHDGLVQRWTAAGDEGAFVICSYWLVTCRAMLGETERARELFEHVTSHANDVGLLAEEIDVRDGELLGNFPQALSHIGLINAAWAIAQAEEDGRP